MAKTDVRAAANPLRVPITVGPPVTSSPRLWTPAIAHGLTRLMPRSGSRRRSTIDICPSPSSWSGDTVATPPFTRSIFNAQEPSSTADRCCVFVQAPTTSRSHLGATPSIFSGPGYDDSARRITLPQRRKRQTTTCEPRRTNAAPNPQTILGEHHLGDRQPTGLKRQQRSDYPRCLIYRNGRMKLDHGADDDHALRRSALTWRSA